MDQHQVENVDIEAASPPIPTQWAWYWKNTTAVETIFEISGRYAILLVLEGEITLSFKGYSDKTIGRKSLVVIDQQQISHVSWSGGTEVLEFTPPEKIFHFFGSCSRAFQLPCSTVVPFRPELQQWADDLIAQWHRPQEELTDALRCDYCVRLKNILNAYPPLLVGELLVAFRACAMSGENKCQGEMCK